MADVIICCADEYRAMARQLEDALTREAYSVWWSEAAASDFWESDTALEQIGKAQAAIVVWSQSSAGSALFHAQANAARTQGKLIQASADNCPPPIQFDDGRVRSISDWHGETSHPGWRAIVADVEALSGRSNGSARARISEVVSSLIRRGEPVANGADRAGGAKRSAYALDILLPLIVLASMTAGAVGWASGRASSPAPAPEAATLPATPHPLASREPISSAAPLRVADAVPAPALELPKVNQQAPKQETNPAPKPEAREAEAPNARPKQPKARTKARRKQPRSVRYRYSENMRLFCRGAGQTTAECRIFRRNTPKSKR